MFLKGDGILGVERGGDGISTVTNTVTEVITKEYRHAFAQVRYGKKAKKYPLQLSPATGIIESS